MYGADKFKALYGEIKAIDEGGVIQAPDGFKLEMNGREFEYLRYSWSCASSLLYLR